MEIFIRNKHKITLTAVTVLSYFAYGLNYNILGQTQKSLESDSGIATKTFSYVFTCRSVFYCVGNIFFVWIFEHVNRQLMYALNLAIMGVSMALTPVFPGFVYFLVNQAVFGFSAGGFDVASNVLVLELWSEKSQPFLQAVHLCFLVGGTIASLISSPFVAPDNSTHNHENNSITTIDSPHHKSEIYIPYLITGCVAVISGIIVFIYELMSPHVIPNRMIRRKNERLINNELNDTQQESENNNSIGVNCALLPSSYYYTMITLSAFFFCFYKTFEFNILTYLTLLVDSFELEFTETSGSRIVATFMTLFCVFRFIAIFLSIKSSPVIMLYISIIILFMTNLVMFVSGWTTVSLVWVTAGFFGAGCAWIYGALLTFVEERIDVTNVVAGSFMCLVSLATAVEPLIIGRFIENNPLIFVYVNFLDVAIVAILFGFLILTDFWKKSILKRNLQS